MRELNPTPFAALSVAVSCEEDSCARGVQLYMDDDFEMNEAGEIARPRRRSDV